MVRMAKTVSAQAHPTASQSMAKECNPSGIAQSSVHSTTDATWWITVPWQCSRPSRHSRHTTVMTHV
jgi:hypothetical protein